ncbi:Clavaminate synthase-like protein [Venturia nashicola]|uniref:Clavaminate synthase-like protein n=1 Tax=Venturia nashicola TaxID=86259 RepID=A0A4Z1NR44_9PEZI|nr:Clavaminate synthase-like protein [Venturia nashicola]TLD28076.1 Clavaminate synthase-like protein [Venturia nashicola]
MKSTRSSIEELITTYQDVNSSQIDDLAEEPSPLEFMRYVARNRPFVVRKGASDWYACRKWSAGFLKEEVGHEMVQVAVTPFGNADSIVDTNEGPLFVKPHETSAPFSAVLSKIQSQEINPSTYKGHTHYLQTQNDNLRNEYATLFSTSKIPDSIPFARIALQKPPEAINFWLGNSKSVTALHKDPYENIYVQVLGKKHFVLLPPVEAPVVGEKWVRSGTYVPSPSSPPSSPPSPSSTPHPVDLNSEYTLAPTPDIPPHTLPFATYDPDSPLDTATPFSHLSKPLRVTLEPGDMLYLPALWYHKVSQTCDDEGICCAINYWYDMDFSGSFWCMAGFVRGVGTAVCGQGREKEMEMDEGES